MGKILLILFLSGLIASSIANPYVYNDTIARKFMYPLSAAAFTKNPQTCMDNKIPGAKVIRQLTIPCDPSGKDSCSGYTVVSDEHKAIMMVFRGSTSNFQVLFEGIESVFDQEETFVGGGKVSKYFNDGFMGLWNAGMKYDFLSLRNQHTDYDIWITGHSLGAAMAAISAAYITSLSLVPSEQVKLITFGEPRSGNADFATMHEKMVPHAYRVVHHRDIVPHLPLVEMEYKHHRTEIFYDNDMSTPTYKTCADAEDNSCSDGFLDLSMDDHMIYFNVWISHYGLAGCVQKL